LAVGVERVAREVEADRVELVLELFDRRPILDHGQRRPLGKAAIKPAEQAFLLADAILGSAARLAQQQIYRRQTLRPVRVQSDERAGLDQALELPPVETLGVEPAGKIEQILVAPVGLSLGDEVTHRLGSDTLDRRERVADRRLAGL